MKREHLPILDILRGIAAAIVCLFHFTNGHLPKLTNPITKSLFIEGGVGVYVFFVISGFIIPFVLSYGKYSFSYNDISKFLAKRFIRISPPAWIALLLLIFLWIAIDLFLHSPTRYLNNISVRGLLSNFFYVAPFFNEPWFNGVFWTLNVEFQYYIFIALSFPFIFKNNKTLIVSSLILSSVVLFIKPNFPFSEDSIYGNVFFTYYVFFALGFITFQFFLNKINFAQFLFIICALEVIILIKYNNVILFASLITSIFIAFVRYKNAVLEFMGKISYSLYLTHMISGAAFEGGVGKIFIFDSTTIKVIMQVFAFVFSIGFAYLFFRFCESPFIKMGGKLFKEKNKRKVVQYEAIL